MIGHAKESNMTKQLIPRSPMRTAANIFLLFSIAGCMNMPSKPSQITGAYVSSHKYVEFSCEKLATELSSLSRRENQLVTAQEQRYKTSESQAFWLGYGQGDGIEASELANVRGEREAVLKSIEEKKCK